MTTYSAKNHEAVETDLAPSPRGSYSQAIRANGFLFIGGQIGVDPKTDRLVSKNVAEQTQQIVKNLKAILAEDKLGFDRVVKTTIYLLDIGDFVDVNEVYSKCFRGDHPPVRATVQVSALRWGAKVEIDAIAVE
jgi:2-iminobutanoate/2-iminopropanoate deaminase